VAERHAESRIITSFVLRSTECGSILRHRPGQYLTFWLDIPGHPPIKRNYGISSAADGRSYRISVKREPHGLVSNWLHNHAQVGTILKIAPPAGEFFLPERPGRPVALPSGGVGLTPMMSMLETIVDRHPKVQAHYVHGTLDGSPHTMRQHVRQLATRHPAIKVTTFYKPRGSGTYPGATSMLPAGSPTSGWPSIRHWKVRIATCADPGRS
jgi:nitric oxide dioxygenase